MAPLMWPSPDPDSGNLTVTRCSVADQLTGARRAALDSDAGLGEASSAESVGVQSRRDIGG